MDRASESPWTGDPNGVNTRRFTNDDEIAYRNSTGGSESGQYTINGGGNWASMLVAFKLAGGVPGPPLFNMPAVGAIVVPGRAGWQNAGHSR